jgi:hypothetical protein
MGREHSSQQGTDDTGHGICRTEQARVRRTLTRRRREGDDDVDTAGNAGRTGTGNRASHDQRRTVLRHRTDQRPDLEDENRQQIRVLQREEFVSLAPRGLERGQREEKCGSVPADLVERVEFICDLGDGRGDDGHVQGDQEHGQDQGDDDEDETGCFGIFALVLCGRRPVADVPLFLGLQLLIVEATCSTRRGADILLRVDSCRDIGGI